MSLPVYHIVTPDGECFPMKSWREAESLLCMLPYGTKIDPPVPEGNRAAMMFLDHLCDQPNQPKL